VLLTAVLAEGQTELRNAAIEPEIVDLICILQKMGAVITMEPNRVIFIEGVPELRGYNHRAIFDRNEAASWASAALATGGDVFLEGVRQEEMMTFLNIFRKVGGDFDVHDDGIRFWHPGGTLKPVTIETDVHPGFMTDWQQPLVVALTQADGVSTIHETVYENRFGFTDALNKMGADIAVHPDGLHDEKRRVMRREFEQAAVITGPTPLTGADIVVPDLRGGFSYLIAGLTAQGQTRVSNLGIISRGYENFIEKLRLLGADFVFEG
jgi:UDP-N-acetylglucosamine 1-carboxyvinyltransferase